MREWADVYIDDVDDRVALSGKALFFVPSAIDVVKISHNLSTNKLSSFSTMLKSTKAMPYAGRSAIKKVMDCQPVVYDSAVGFINVCNRYFENESIEFRFTKSNIVACVFCLREFSALIGRLGREPTSKAYLVQMASAIGIDFDIIKSAIGGFRITFDHAEKIRIFACGDAVAKGIEPEALGFDPSFSNLIVTRLTSPAGISIKKKPVKKGDDEDYVYRRLQLHPAPPQGHAWCIDNRAEGS